MTNEMRFDFDVHDGEVDLSSVKVSIHNAPEIIDICESYYNGQCGCFDEDYPDDAPSNCDCDGLCIDEFDDGCSDYAPADTHCGECGKAYENCECEE